MSNSCRKSARCGFATIAVVAVSAFILAGAGTVAYIEYASTDSRPDQSQEFSTTTGFYTENTRSSVSKNSNSPTTSTKKTARFDISSVTVGDTFGNLGINRLNVDRRADGSVNHMTGYSVRLQGTTTVSGKVIHNPYTDVDPEVCLDTNKKQDEVTEWLGSFRFCFSNQTVAKSRLTVGEVVTVTISDLRIITAPKDGIFNTAELAGDTAAGSVSTNNKEAPDNWKTFRSDSFGFSFQYPDVYPSLSSTTKRTRSKGSTKNSKNYDMKALNSASTRQRNYPTITMNVWPLDKYFFDVLYARKNIKEYEAQTQKWIAYQDGNKENATSFTPSMQLVGGRTGYRFNIGDAGNVRRVIAVPHPEGEVMVELGFGTGPKTTEQIDRQQILSSFSFF